MELWQLRQRQSLPLEVKIVMSQLRIQQWYEVWDGQVCVSFSGGKDSTVLLRMVREIYPKVPAVFVDTGLEYPEIRDFVKTVDNVVWIKPKMQFQEVINQYGFPLISKEIALTIYYAKKGSKWAVKKLNGGHKYGNHKKYKFLLNAPFAVSDKCCGVMKKKPFKEFQQKTGLKPFIGTMASEGGQRESGYKKTGCNAFKIGKSMPLGFWREQDVWDYIKNFNVPYSKIYDMGYSRTGCMFCMFGANLEERPNRFERMKHTHPKQWKYCMTKLGLAQVFDYIGVPWGGQMDLMDYPGVIPCNTK